MAMPRLTLVDVVWLFRTHQSNSRQTHPVSFFEPRADEPGAGTDEVSAPLQGTETEDGGQEG